MQLQNIRNIFSRALFRNVPRILLCRRRGGVGGPSRDPVCVQALPPHDTRKADREKDLWGRASRAECRVLDNINTGRSEGRVERGVTANCWLLTHV